MKVIEGAKENGQVKGAVRQKGKVTGISRPALHFCMLAFKDFKIVLYEFYCSYIPAFVGKGDTVAPCSGTYVCNLKSVFVFRKVVVNVFHGHKVFHHSMAGCQAVVFLVLVVVFFDGCHELVL